MSGVIGRCVYENSHGESQIVRISVLDPAFPTFYPSFGTQAVSKNDAQFVDIIHTDAWIYGIPISTGHVDFWPNNGKTLQPGCPRREMIFSFSDVGEFDCKQNCSIQEYSFNEIIFFFQIFAAIVVVGGFGQIALH